MIACPVQEDDLIGLGLMQGKLKEQVLKIKGVYMRGSYKEKVALHGIYQAIAIAVDKAVLINAYWLDAR